MEDRPHKRRAHYPGKYPKKYEEKYKELNPEKYGDTIEHVIEKGGTPAGMHISIMVKEVLDALQIQPGMQGCDCTLGYGGHTQAMLEKLCGKEETDIRRAVSADPQEFCLKTEMKQTDTKAAPGSHLVSLDIDPIESVKTEMRLRDKGYGPDLLAIEHINFADLDLAAEKYGKFDFLMADLGVSSMQIDNPERGFSYKTEGPLDLRMNPEKGEPASERLKKLSEGELTGLLIDNSDEPYAEEIAKVISRRKWKKQAIETTTDLADAVAEALHFLPEAERKNEVKKSCARVFQALRIDVNSEFESLESLMEKLPLVMKSGGRAAILTFHSGEDRIVKKAFKTYYKKKICREISDDVTRPSKEECYRNPRAKSTKLRWAVFS
ncbi:MAG: 16S rRNA (cytosine(1402)-N(4))-methyltransferase RsmH [Eubacterium sp.]|nr:16S rRNA (cytosine(1402)-N(4))-methyltransferase RsmH [Eubacterium sp.]